MTSLLAVTGSTGRLGGRIAKLLVAAGIPQRLVVRDRSRAPELQNTKVVQASYDDGSATIAALSGCETALMVSASESADRVRDHKRFVDAAAEAGVRHLVYTSFFGAAPDAAFTLARDHWATEKHIIASGMKWTFLRDNLYLDFFPLFAGDDGVTRGPAGEGRVAAVALDDVADAAVAVLSAPSGHECATYHLTGPEAITFAEAAETMSRLLGRTFRYHPENIEEAHTSRAKYGAPDWQVKAWVTTYTAVAAGELAGVSDDVRRLTGHPPMSLAEVLGR